MIYIILDHSYEDDYHMIAEINVNISDISEKERVEKLVEQLNIEGNLVDVDNNLGNRIAELLDVDSSIIDFDTNEIDLM